MRCYAMREGQQIWLTRPQADSALLAEQLTTHGMASLIAPVMEITPCPLPPLPRTMPDAILLTSRHAMGALAALPEPWRAQPVYCVGNATAQAAQAHAAHIIDGGGEMTSLLPLLQTNLMRGQTLCYLRGEEVRTDVTAALLPQGIRVEEMTCYRATASAPSPALLHALEADGLSGVACYSARSAAIVCEWVTPAQAARMELFALSPAVAQAAQTLPWKRMHIAHAPNAEAMLEIMTRR